MRYGLIAAVLFGSACGGGGKTESTPVAPAQPKVVQVQNYLYLPIALNSGSTTFGTLAGGNGFGPATATVSVPAANTSLTYVVQPQRYSDGSPMPNDLSGETITISGNSTLGVTNSVSGQPYIMIIAQNAIAPTATTVQTAISQGGLVQCLSNLASSDIQFLGYYRLTASTEFRIYRAGSTCTGAYRYWDYSTLSGYAVSTGIVNIRPTLAP